MKLEDVEKPQQKNDNRRPLGFAITIIILTFILLFHILVYRTSFKFMHSFCYYSYRTNFETITDFRFVTPLDSILFWLPGVYMAFEVYRSRKNEFQTRKRFLTKIFLATCFAIFMYVLAVSFLTSSETPFLVPLPYATVISAIYGVKYYPQPKTEPWLDLSAEKDD